MTKKRIVTSNSFNQSPSWFRMINKTWEYSYFLGTRIRIDKDSLIQLARRQTGLNAFGKDFRDEPLDRLIDSINQEADLSPLGRYIARKRLTGLLATRLRAENWLTRHPEILEQELYPVSLICGLQRTGTTKLHRLLSADPENRVLLSWEALNPVPWHGGSAEVDRRKRAARISEKALQIIAPGFFSIHPVEYEKPEEDILLLDTTFLSTTPEATMYVPTYAAWLEQTDQSFAYEYLVKLLKILQWQRPARRWILKSPHHMEFLDLASRYFGKVHFIWTHRNISESLPSFISMVAHSQAIFSKHVSLEKITGHWVRKTGYMLSKGVAFRRANADLKFTDVFFEELIASPMGVLKKLYSNGQSITPELEMKFLETERQNAPNRFGFHIYKPEDFNLKPEELKEAAGQYMDFLNTIQR